ncbi:MAG: alpha/beta hydrolase [Halioglobus sp.]
MPKVFVHGVPETNALWGPLFDELSRLGTNDLVSLSPPGFGAHVPAGFEATQTGYRSWLIQQLENLGGNVDIVGHDWGAAHVYGVLAERPDLLRSWSADCAGLIHHDYVWHDGAQAWQTPEVGEQAVEAMFGLPQDQMVEMFMSLGVPKEIASELASQRDPDMGKCVLSLYRSAAQPQMQKLGEHLKTTGQRPGMVFIATDDHYAGTPEMCVSVASDLGASVHTLEGQGHWWMFEGAASAAQALQSHWARA